jgi:hypothetical protein
MCLVVGGKKILILGLQLLDVELKKKKKGNRQ